MAWIWKLYSNVECIFLFHVFCELEVPLYTRAIQKVTCFGMARRGAGLAPPSWCQSVRHSVYRRDAKPRETSRRHASRNATACVAGCPTQVERLPHNSPQQSNHQPSEMASQPHQGCNSKSSAVHTISSTKTINHASAKQINTISAYNTNSAI